MRNRAEPLLKLICLALAAILLAKVAHRLMRLDPIGHAVIPPLPTLSSNAEPKPSATNSPRKMISTNAIASTNSVNTNKSLPPANMMARAHMMHHGGRMGMPMMMGMGMGMGMGGVKLPSVVQARVDRIKESEILGLFMRPMPMALMGIADDDVFLRAPNGQTGLVKVGKELDGVKILRIGINRVLVEQDGEKKELTLFNGAGGESLMPPEPAPSTNATSQSTQNKQKDTP